MDDRVCDEVAREVWSEDFSRSLAQLRRNAEELLRGERTKWQSTEAVLLRQIVELRETIAKEESRSETLRDELAKSRQRLDEETVLLNEVIAQARQRQEAALQSQARLEEERRAFLEEFGRKSGELELTRRELSLAQEELSRRREALAEETAKLEQRAAELSARHVALQVKTDEQKTAQHELELERKRLTDLKNELDAAKQALDRERDLLQLRQRETAAQRRRLAREFRLQRMQLLAEVHQGGDADAAVRGADDDEQVRLLREEIAVRTRQQESLEQQLLELREQLSAASAEEERLRNQLAAAQSAAGDAGDQEKRVAELLQQLDELQTSLDRANSECKTLQTELHSEREQQSQLEAKRKREVEAFEHEINQLREQLQRGVMESESELAEARMAAAQAKVENDRQKEQLAALRKQLDAKISEIADLKTRAEASEASGEALAELESLRAERDELAAEVERLREQLDAAPAASSEGVSEEHQAEIVDLRNRLEMAMADLRQANAQIADLKLELSEKKAGAAAAEPGLSDWEHQKRLLLAQLEADEASTPQQKKERLKIEEVIAKTDSVIAEKDAEIAELKALLEMRPQAADAADTAFGAAAISQLLDSDELIKQQREALERMTQELQEKLRQAEIDTSLERAKLARERAELQEQLQQLEEERQKLLDNPNRSSDQIKSPGRRNWLDHLGLNKNGQGG